MDKKYFVTMFAILGLMGVALILLKAEVDGNLFALIILAIAGLGGYEIRRQLMTNKK